MAFITGDKEQDEASIRACAEAGSFAGQGGPQLGSVGEVGSYLHHGPALDSGMAASGLSATQAPHTGVGSLIASLFGGLF